jgi:hypothetical protein
MPKNKAAHIGNGADLPRDIAVILDEKILSGNSHLQDFMLTTMPVYERFVQPLAFLLDHPEDKNRMR